MRNLQIVLFVIAMVISTTQTYRHVYVKWIEPQASVLAEFKVGAESEIATAETIEELVPLFAETDRAVKAYESDPTNPPINHYERQTTEPYASRQKLEGEILAREQRTKQIVELRFYWAGGLLSIIVGAWAYRRINRWVGISGVIVGFSEMLFWTSPLVHRAWHGQEFVALINSKLTFSAITLVLLVGMWLLVARNKLLPTDQIDS